MRRYNVVAIGLAAFVLSIVWGSSAFAQRYVDVPAGYGTLQTILVADSANRAAEPNTVYRLHRGTADSIYILSTTLSNWGSMPLRIESVGSGGLPTMCIATLSDGTPISPIISVKANLSIKGVYLTGVNTLGATTDRLVRIQKTGVRLEVDSCQVNMSTQSFIRVDNDASGIFLRNCRVSNIFSDWSNARGIDNRGVTIDTLSVSGCTFYRLGQRAYRDGGGILRNAYFNHNTFVDIGGPVVSLGSDSSLVFTNNLIVNCGFLGDGISGSPRLVGMTPLPGGQAAYVANNVFYTDSAKLHAAYSDTTQFFSWFADTLIAFINNAGTAATNIHSPVTFTLPPDNAPNAVKVDSIASWYWKNLPTSSTNAAILKVDSGYVNLAYNTNAVAYTWGSGGTPAGSVEWFGIPLVGVVQETGGSVPTEFMLSQNYPNPFNPMTTISYSLPKATQVTVTIFDLLGREIASLVNASQVAGTHSVTFDATSLSSGTYFYQLKTQQYVTTKKMVLMK